MNNDLIKRIAVRDMLHDEMEAWGNCADEIEALLKANDALWEIPAVDAVEVVRCASCKWCVEKDELTKCGHCCCKHRDVFVNDPTGFEAVSLDDFCSYGERREHDGTR